MKKFRLPLIIIALCYVAGVVVSFFITKDAESFITHFTSIPAIVGLGGGIFLGLFILLDKKDTKKDDATFKGKTEDGREVNQHYDAKFINEEELAKNPKFMPTVYKNLPKLKKTGTFISSLYKDGQLRVNMYPECHELIIGTTGSGKTTMILEPAIRVYAHSAEKPCMVITDPKGELYNNHSIQLREEGYRIIVLDLRNPFASSRWNPMDHAYVEYQRAHRLEKEVKIYKDATPEQVGLRTIPDSKYGNEWYSFNGVAYPTKEQLKIDIKSMSQALINDAENELREIAMEVLPVSQNSNDSSWEQGAQDYVYGIMLAMLEDSLEPELGMTRERFNFYNLAKICTYRDSNPDNMMGPLKDYAEGRSINSKVKPLVSTVVNNAPNTTRSFLGVMQPKIAIFQDMGVCYATSQSDISFEDFVSQPTVLFIKVPDEKESRHCIATICIAQLYKTLIDIASKTNNKLPRQVYFLLDEFANLPKIQKMGSMITVARSRNIFFQLVIQSYTQLDNKYGKEIADTIKSNCNIQIFVGTADQQTLEEFSKRCGNITIQIENKSTTKDKKDSESSTNTSIQTTQRALIEPYELGHLETEINIVSVYAQSPIKTHMTPWYKSPVFSKEKASEQYVPAKYFDESKYRYDFIERNKKKLNKNPFDFDF